MKKIRAVNFPGKLGDVYLRLGFRSNLIEKMFWVHMCGESRLLFLLFLTVIKRVTILEPTSVSCVFAKLGWFLEPQYPGLATATDGAPGRGLLGSSHFEILHLQWVHCG